mgnify:CR=1 FL=1
MAKTQRLTEYAKKYEGSSLFLGNMRLTKAPADIFTITSLTQLYLPDNFLVSLPRAIGKLVKLQQLYLDNNVIGPTLCAEIGNLKELRVLSLRFVCIFYMLLLYIHCVEVCKCLIVSCGLILVNLISFLAVTTVCKSCQQKLGFSRAWRILLSITIG